MTGLLIGGHSGIGQAFAERTKSSSEEWMIPTQRDLDVTIDGDISGYVIRHGPFDRVVYSAGLDRLDRLGFTNPVTIRKVLDVNVVGFISLVDAMMSSWPRDAARVVVVGSDAAERPMRTSTAYCASKAAVHMAARTMARELGGLGWRINVVAPGMTDETGMQEYVDRRVPEVRDWTPEFAREYERQQEVVPGRVSKHEVAELIWFALHGPDHLNGSILTINGGR